MTECQTSEMRPRGNVSYDHSGRVVIVTGGCSGIGLAICEGFMRANATVVALDLHAPPASAASAGIRWIATDVAKEKDCEAAVQTIFDEYGGIDVLVNNAAIQPPSSYVRVDQLESDALERMLAVNFCGYIHMAKYALRVMREQRCGVVVNIASGQAHRTARSVPVYGPIKAANVLQAMQWGIEYARDGIRVLSISPGAIDTPLVRASLEAQGGERELANRHPIGRLGKPEEVAHAVLWLSSEGASFITATDLSVDGGLGAFGAFADPYKIVS